MTIIPKTHGFGMPQSVEKLAENGQFERLLAAWFSVWRPLSLCRKCGHVEP
jgi:hypothetical protein